MWEGDQWFALFQAKARSRLKEVLERGIEATPQHLIDKLEQLEKVEQNLAGRKEMRNLGRRSFK